MISGDQVRSGMRALGWTTTELAKFANIPFATASRAKLATGDVKLTFAQSAAIVRAFAIAGHQVNRAAPASASVTAEIKPSPRLSVPISSSTKLDVRKLRSKLKMTRNEFAERFGFPASLVRDWETGGVPPLPAALAYLETIATDPDAVLLVLKNSVKKDVGAGHETAPASDQHGAG